MTRRDRRSSALEAAWLLLALLLTQIAAPASAQRCRQTCELDAAARRATAEGRLADADQLLSESLALEPRPATLYNLAVVRQNRGLLVDAQAMLERLLAGELGRFPPRRRAEVVERLATVVSSIGTVSLTLTGTVTPAEIRIDGRVVGTTTDALRVRTDPGPHTIAIRLDDGREIPRRVEVAPGETVEVRVSIPRPPPVPVEPLIPLVVEEPEPEPAASPTRRRRVLGAVAGVLLAGAAVGLAIGLSGRSEPAQPPDAPPSFLGNLQALTTF